MANAIEKNYPYFLAVLCAVISYFLIPQYYIFTALKKLPDSIITVSSILAGLTIAYKGILIAVDDKAPIERLKKRGKYSQLLGYVSLAILSAIIVAGISVILIVIIEETVFHEWYKFAFSIWLGSLVIAVTSFARLSSIMTLILKFGERAKKAKKTN